MKDKLMAATGGELSQLLGKALGTTHEPMLYGPYDDPPSTSISCRHCYTNVQNEIRNRITDKQRDKFYKLTCRIALTPDNAFKWRNWAVKEYGEPAMSDAMRDVFTSETGRHNAIPVHLDWFIFNAEPEHYLEAAALCKLNAEESK